MQRRRTKPLRGGPISGSPMGIESPDPMPREPPGGVLGVTSVGPWTNAHSPPSLKANELRAEAGLGEFPGSNHPIRDPKHAWKPRFPGLVGRRQELPCVRLDRRDAWHTGL